MDGNCFLFSLLSFFFHSFIFLSEEEYQCLSRLAYVNCINTVCGNEAIDEWTLKQTVNINISRVSTAAQYQY